MLAEYLVLHFFVGGLAGVVYGIVSGAIAHSRGHEPIGWLFLGLAFGLVLGPLLGWLSIVIASVLPNRHAQRALEGRLQRMESEIRELRELLGRVGDGE